MEIQNASTTSSKSNQLRNVNSTLVIILEVISIKQNYNMDSKFPAMMTMNINFDDLGIVILKKSGDRDLNMINVV